MKPQKADQTEVTQHLVERMTSVFSSNALWVSCTEMKTFETANLEKEPDETFFSFTSTGVDLKLAVNVALVHQGVENVENAVDIPDFWIVPQELDLLL